MVEIIERDSKGEQFCFNCGTKFSYTKEDVELYSIEIQSINERYTLRINLGYAVRCPVCEKMCLVDCSAFLTNLVHNNHLR